MQEQLFKQLNYIHEYINRADNKMHILLGFHFLLIAPVVKRANEVFSYFLRSLNYQSSGIDPSKCIFLGIFFVFLILFAYFEGKFLYLFYRTLLPDLSTEDKVGTDYKSVIFWGHIAWKYRDLNEFRSALEKAIKDENIYEDDIITQIYINSLIASHKFEKVQKAYTLLPWSIVIAVITYLIGNLILALP